MLQRLVHSNGLVTYRSNLLARVGIAHGFSTRIGGVSVGPYASLNLGCLAKGTDGDQNTRVAENYRRLRAALGLERVPRIEVRQVHQAGVWVVPADGGLSRPADMPCADALVTDRAGVMLTVRVADCVPVLLSDEQGRVIAAVHAGWRGVVAGVVLETLRVMRERFGIGADKVLAAIGPCISVAHFEVGPEVADAFRTVGLDKVVLSRGGGRPLVDLARGVTLQLERCGVAIGAIEHTDRCTWRDADEFFSHRRDRGVTGRMAAVIARLDSR